MANRKPRKRYSRSLVVDFFDALHGNTKPCVVGECPIVVAMGGRISVADATALDSTLAGTFDEFCRKNFGSSLAWEQLIAAKIAEITRDVMKQSALSN